MPILGTVRREVTVSPQPYVDTPTFNYATWMGYLHTNNKAIGSVSQLAKKPNIAVIGGGVSGLCAAYELVRAGCSVTVFEAKSNVGGRCDSYYFHDGTSGGGNVVELGAMRFPPSEFLLNYYLQTVFNLAPKGIAGLPDFPDPGVNPTYICLQNNTPELWTYSSAQPYPPGFSTVYNGWISLVNNGLTKGGTQVLASPTAITQDLVNGNVAQAVSAWQAWLDTFGQTSFYSAIYQIFTGKGGYSIPGGTAWTTLDFQQFATLGIGSGGFGPLYAMNFPEILRLVVNNLETTQKFFAGGIAALPQTFASNASATVLTTSPVSSIAYQSSSGTFALSGPGGAYGSFDRVIIATTTRSMELSTNITNFFQSGDNVLKTGSNLLLGVQTSEAVKQTHITSSNKVAARIANFWADDPTVARTLLCDTAVHQVYTLDYGVPGTGVCFISYSWEDDAIKQQGLGLTLGVPTAGGVYIALLGILNEMGGAISSWAKNLTPLNNDYLNNVQFIEWQREAYFFGAFKLSQPGQDVNVQTMFYDFQKAGNAAKDTGVYLAGDCINWCAGWVEGALQSALNAAAGVIKSVGGTLNGDANGNTPMNLNPSEYNYSGGIG